MDGRGSTRWSASGLLYSRIAAGALSLTFAGILWATIEKDGSPFRSSLLTPWMVTTLIDFYLSYLVLLLWVFTRETPLKAIAWSLYLCCLGSVAVWSYVLYVLLTLRAGDPLSKFWLGGR